MSHLSNDLQSLFTADLLEVVSGIVNKPTPKIGDKTKRTKVDTKPETTDTVDEDDDERQKLNDKLETLKDSLNRIYDVKIKDPRKIREIKTEIEKVKTKLTGTVDEDKDAEKPSDKKHKLRFNKAAVDHSIASSNRSGRRIGSKEGRIIRALLKGRQKTDE